MARRMRVVVLVSLLAWPGIASAQAKAGFSITPFLGAADPGRDLLLRPGLQAGLDQEKQAIYGLVGARIGFGLTPLIELEADIASGKSGLKVSTLAAPSGTDASVLTMTGRVSFRLKQPIEPMWITVNGGVAALKRSFSQRTPGVQTAISDKTSAGAVFGSVVGFRMSRRASLTIGADVFLYNASFHVAATGTQPAGETQALTQRDIRVTMGVRIPLTGL
ncbi:MAG: hypothetical protein AB7L66_15795 [Gemmatimonadales bacterium]